MFENIKNMFKKIEKKQEGKKTKEEAKERLHLVLLQDRANVSADFLDMMKQEIIEVIKKYIDIDEKEMDVKLTNKQNSDGTTGAPALYANIPIVAIKSETRKATNKLNLEKIDKQENKNEKESKNNVKDNKKKEDKKKSKEENKENTKKEADKKENDENITKTESKKDNSENVENKESKKDNSENIENKENKKASTENKTKKNKKKAKK